MIGTAFDARIRFCQSGPVARKHLSWKMVAIALMLMTGCDEGSPTQPESPPRVLPATFRVTGTAESTESDGTTVKCLLDLNFELDGSPRQSPGMLEYEGTHGGSIRRTVLDAEGDGISLWPDVYGRAVARSITPDRVELLIPINADTESRFWRELSRFQGRFDSVTTASGAWNCAPFDITEGGYVDTLYTARGTWTLVPIPR